MWNKYLVGIHLIFGIVVLVIVWAVWSPLPAILLACLYLIVGKIEIDRAEFHRRKRIDKRRR